MFNLFKINSSLFSIQRITAFKYWPQPLFNTQTPCKWNLYLSLLHRALMSPCLYCAIFETLLASGFIMDDSSMFPQSCLWETWDFILCIILYLLLTLFVELLGWARFMTRCDEYSMISLTERYCNIKSVKFMVNVCFNTFSVMNGSFSYRYFLSQVSLIWIYWIMIAIFRIPRRIPVL